MAATSYYVTSDALGSVTGILDEEGNVIERRSYDAFGEMNCTLPGSIHSVESSTEVDVGFQGQTKDEVTRLYQLGFRWINTTIGRWITRDPLELKGGINNYVFNLNAPSTYEDPFGLSTKEAPSPPPPTPVNLGISVPNGDISQDNLFDSVAALQADEWNRNLTGAEMIDSMKKISKNNCCIKKLTIAGHGWSAGGNGNGIPGAIAGSHGLYTTGFKHDSGGASIADLAKEIKEKTIKFCKPCLIQIHSCRISSEFVISLASATGCRVVAAATSCRPLPSNPKLWQSVPGVWKENPRGGGGFSGFRQSNAGGKIENLSETYDPRQDP
jgi:RHS repeat-associated protein